jgi:hypothetical protein
MCACDVGFTCARCRPRSLTDAVLEAGAVEPETVHETLDRLATEYADGVVIPAARRD